MRPFFEFSCDFPHPENPTIRIRFIIEVPAFSVAHATIPKPIGAAGQGDCSRLELISNTRIYLPPESMNEITDQAVCRAGKITVRRRRAAR